MLAAAATARSTRPQAPPLLCSLSLGAEQKGGRKKASLRHRSCEPGNGRSLARRVCQRGLPPAKPTATHTASRSAASAAMAHSTCESCEWLLPCATLSVRVGDQSVVPEPRALKPDLLLLHLLLAPLAAALHVCHSSLCRQSSAPSRARPCRALRKCDESAAKVHDQSTGAVTPPEPHSNVRFQARGSTSESTSVLAATPGRLPHRAARRLRTATARVLREFFAWPAARAVLRGRAALACDSSSGAPTPGGLASRHEPRSREPTPSPPMPHRPSGPFLSLKVMIIGQP